MLVLSYILKMAQKHGMNDLRPRYCMFCCLASDPPAHSTPVSPSSQLTRKIKTHLSAYQRTTITMS